MYTKQGQCHRCGWMSANNVNLFGYDTWLCNFCQNDWFETIRADPKLPIYNKNEANCEFYLHAGQPLSQSAYTTESALRNTNRLYFFDLAKKFVWGNSPPIILTQGQIDRPVPSTATFDPKTGLPIT